jgi:hypothetical protein
MTTAFSVKETSLQSAGYFMKVRRIIADLQARNLQENEFMVLLPLCGELRQSWCEAAFSPMPDHALRRYFSFQLESIRDILDTSPFPELPGQGHPVKDEFIALINYLFQYFKNFLYTDLISPTAYRNYKLASLDGIVNKLVVKLNNAAIDEGLRNIVESYLKEMICTDPNIHDTYHSLNYFEQFVKALNQLNLGIRSAEELLILTLTNLNFNHVAFFYYRRNKVSTAIAQFDKVTAMELLESEKRAIFQRIQGTIIYDKSWPGITEMLHAYFDEEIQKVNSLTSHIPAVQSVMSAKANLGLSVAQIALLVKLSFDENFLPKNSLTDIFKFISRHFSSKRQSTISAASLSKEYYSVSQVTAAVVRDMLQKMIARINHTFFPVWVVIGSAILCSLNSL